MALGLAAQLASFTSSMSENAGPRGANNETLKGGSKSVDVRLSNIISAKGV